MKLAIIGAGAAGCFAATNMNNTSNHEIFIFEKTAKSLQKVKVSGGGRCNVTHACFDIPVLLDKYPRGKQLLRKTLYKFGPAETVQWFEQRGVQLKQEPDGRMFPITDDSQTIIDCLLAELQKKKIPIQYHKSIERIEKKEEQFQIFFADQTHFMADRILIACGGFPKLDQYHWLTALGHRVQPPVPSLFTFNLKGQPITELMGVVVQEVTVKIAGTKITESGPLLITHWGFSGPAVLRTSAWAARELAEREYEFVVMVNWLHKKTEADLKEEIAAIRKTHGKQLLQHKNPFHLPKRFWEYLLWKNQINPDVKWGELSATSQNKLMDSLLFDRYEVQGKTTFKEEFVTCGGISLNEVNPATLESRLVPGLFFAGEILDVDGITGGFNFQHAWASAFIVADAMSK
jgi:predicted Rossmann fold flavoprotein